MEINKKAFKGLVWFVSRFGNFSRDLKKFKTLEEFKGTFLYFFLEDHSFNHLKWNFPKCVHVSDLVMNSFGKKAHFE